MFSELLLKPFEWTVNKMCRSDECFFPRLQPYQNKVLRLRSRDGFCQCDCVIKADYLYFYGDCGTVPDVTLVLTPQFIKDWLCDPKNPLVFFTSAYEIQGDMVLAEALKGVFATLEVDIEGHLAQWLGDPVATNLCYGANEMAQWCKTTATQGREHLREYLQEETTLLVPPVLVEEFVTHTHELRGDVDRLEARINRLLTLSEA